MQSADDGARRGADHLERDGCRNWHWRCVLQRSRLRRLAWTGAQADIDWRPHDPRQDIEARQSLPARPVRAAAWVVLIRPKSWERYGLKPWIEAANITPSCGGHAPTAERTLHPARMFTESLTPRIQR